MIRRLYIVAYATSLMLSVAIAVLWARSYSGSDAIQFRLRDGMLWELASRDGRVWVDNRPQVEADFAPLALLMQQTRAAEERARSFSTTDPMEYRRAEELAHEAKLREVRESLRMESKGWVFHPPVAHSVGFLLLLVPTLLLPAIAIGKAIRITHRRANNRCTRCAYDLRASKDRCPECGTPIPSKAGATA